MGGTWLVKESPQIAPQMREILARDLWTLLGFGKNE
jgi:hypothetical protein